MKEPTEAMRERARELWRLTAALTEKPEDWPNEWQPIAQALADEYVRGVRAGVDLVLAEVDDWYRHPAGMLLERIRALKSTP